MYVLIRKVENLGLLRLEYILGTVMMALSMVALPVGILLSDPSLMANPFVLGTVLVVMLLFASLGFFLFILPYILYRKYPKVQVESDGEFLYVHTRKKDAKIPLSEVSEATVTPHLPFIYQWAFIRRIIVHFFSEQYGDVIMEIPGYGKFRMRFISYAERSANELAGYIYRTINNVL